MGQSKCCASGFQSSRCTATWRAMEGDGLNTSPPQARNGQNDQGNRNSKTEIIATSIQVLRMKIESLVLTEITFCERIAREPKTPSRKMSASSWKNSSPTNTQATSWRQDMPRFSPNEIRYKTRDFWTGRPRQHGFKFIESHMLGLANSVGTNIDPYQGTR